MSRGNVDAVLVAAPEIIGRLRHSSVTLGALMDEYHCAYATIVRAVLSQITDSQFRELMAKRHRPTSGCFHKGLRPWNKDRKGWHAPGCEKTWFTKGGIRGRAARRYRPVGSIIIRMDRVKGGYKKRLPSRWIKVKDTGWAQDRYIPLARWLWEQKHGPVPSGYFVVHRDNDRMNNTLGNLILVNRRQLMLRLYDRPDVIEKCRARSARASTRRHAENRAAKQFGRITKKQNRIVWECSACGNDVVPNTDRCPKCQSYAIVVRSVARPTTPKSEPKTLFQE